MSSRSSLVRRVHAVVALVTLVALAYQFWLVLDGLVILAEGQSPPATSTRIVRFFSYFTIQSNLLVLVTAAAIARGVDVSRPGWPVVRLSTLTGIVVTGLVHWFALRPILDLSGGPYVADKLVHVVVPLAAVIAWLWVGPHGLGPWARAVQALVWPVLWAVYTLVRGAIVDWYPYPFLDAGELGAGRTALNVLGIAVLFCAVAAVVVVVDRRVGSRDSSVRA